MPLESIETAELSLSDARWQARIDLAAAHRLAVMHGFHEGIFNHFTLRVPGANDRYYQIPFGLHWSEVTASCFMEIGYDGTRLSGEGEVERSAYCIHAPIHRLNERAAAVFHTHMPFASALARLEDQSILPIGQTELGTLMHTAYDDIYTGPAFDPAEGERMKRYRSLLRGAAESKKIPALEIPELTESAWPESKKLFGERIHPNATGHHLMAERLLAFLAEPLTRLSQK